MSTVAVKSSKILPSTETKIKKEKKKRKKRILLRAKEMAQRTRALVGEPRVSSPLNWD